MTRPNIVCVSVDSVRADYCSIDGEYEKDTTPFLRSIASESTVFRRTIAPSTWTLPVHASVFTGLYPPEHGILTGKETLGDHPTFAQRLSEEGYSTSAFFKNGWLETGDILRGFKYSSENSDSIRDRSLKSRIKRVVSDKIRNGPERIEEIVQAVYDAQNQCRNWSGLGSGRSDPHGGRETVREYISSLSEGDEPFCSFVHLNDAHWRYNPPTPHYDVFSNRSVPELVYNYAWWQYQVYASRTNRLEATVGDVTPPAKEVETFKNLYRGGIRYTDSLIEELVDALKREGVWENTVLVVFGDHGDGFGEDGVFGHHFTVHDSVIHVPMLIRDPTGQLETGTVDHPTSLVDIYPTVLGLAGAAAPDTSGVDLLRESRSTAYSYYDVSEHDLYLGASERGIDPDRLPPEKQYVAWESADQKVIKYPEENEYVKIGYEDAALKTQLDEQIEQLDSVSTAEGSVAEDVAKRLENMGYLRE